MSPNNGYSHNDAGERACRGRADDLDVDDAPPAISASSWRFRCSASSRQAASTGCTNVSRMSCEERRLSSSASEGYLGVIKSLIVLFDHCLYGVMLRRIRLHDGTRPGRAPPRAPRHLGEQLEGTLARAEIGQVEAGVGVDHARPASPGEIEALGHHLRADEDVGLARAGSRPRIACVRAAARSSCRGPGRPTRASGTACCTSSSTRSVPRPRSDVARRRSPGTSAPGCAVAAVVAAQHARAGVVGERHRAVRAARHVAAVAGR